MVLGAVAMVSECGRAASTFRPWREGVSPGPATRVVLFGLGTGWLTGLFGVGGGFVIVPMLVLGLGFALGEAVGTSLLVIILGSLVALFERLGAGTIEWSVIAPFVLAAMVGVLLGSTLGHRVSTAALTRWFAVLVVATAIYTATQALIGLG